jgi:hypothetical protein
MKESIILRQELRRDCGKQNSEMAPRFLFTGAHILYNTSSLSVGGACEYDGFHFYDISKVKGLCSYN